MKHVSSNISTIYLYTFCFSFQEYRQLDQVLKSDSVSERMTPFATDRESEDVCGIQRCNSPIQEVLEEGEIQYENIEDGHLSIDFKFINNKMKYKFQIMSLNKDCQ